MSSRAIHLAHLLLLVVYFGAAVAAMPSLPESIPMHFGSGGQPTRWAPLTWLSWLGLPLVSTGTALFLFLLVRWSRKAPHLWNLPEKQHFVRLPAELRAQVQEPLEVAMALVALLTTVLLAVTHLGFYDVALGRSESLPAYSRVALLVWLVVVIWIAVRAAQQAGREARRVSEGLEKGEARRAE